jgi:hypothetical protein
MCKLGTRLQRKLSRFLYQLVQRVRKSIKIVENSKNFKTNFVGFVVKNTKTFVILTWSES